MESKSYRLREFVVPTSSLGARSLVVDASAGLILGALTGLENFTEAIAPILPLADGVVVSPGQARHLTQRTKAEAALLVRADWTNALRGPDFVLPPETIKHLTLLDPSDALDLGASALVAYFLLGFEEQVEADCLKTTVHLALQGSQAGLPLIVDVQPKGSRVVLPNKAIELGTSYAIEGGADGVVVPWPGTDSLRTIVKMAADLPVWIKPSTLDGAVSELEEALSLGATGCWLDERLFTLKDSAAAVKSFRNVLYNG